MIEHKNNIGLLRLIFASLVIVGHSPELIFGNRVHEPLTMLFGSLSLGEMSVDAFFLLSGFLITKSMALGSSVTRYLQRRLLRIAPAFVVAFLFCVIVMAPFVGAHPIQHLPITVVYLLTLQPPPEYPGMLSGLPDRSLNGSMWTIAYEFRCYIIIAVFGVLGLLRKRWAILALTVLAVAASHVNQLQFANDFLAKLGSHRPVIVLAGAPLEDIRLTTVFLIGSCFYLFKDEVLPRLNWFTALLALMVMVGLMWVRPLAENGVCIFGGAALFWLALKANLGALRHINDEWDISYGVYLYGWPISTVVLWYFRDIGPIRLAAVSLPIALLCGAASWWGLEKHAKDYWGLL